MKGINYGLYHIISISYYQMANTKLIEKSSIKDSSIKLKIKNQSKKTIEAITRYAYYLNHLIPQLFGQNINELDLFWKIRDKKLAYCYGRSQTVVEVLLNKRSIMESIRQAYLCTNNKKINETMFLREASISNYFGFGTQRFEEVLELHCLDQNEQSKGKFEVLVIHKCNTMGICKMYGIQYTQKIVFQPLSKCKSAWRVSYEVIVVHQIKQEWNFYSTFDKLKYYLKQSWKKNQTNKKLIFLERLEGFILKNSVYAVQELKIKNDPAFSQEHLRQPKIPPQHFKNYSVAKSIFLKEFAKDFSNFQKQVQLNLLNQSQKAKEQQIFTFWKKPQKLISLIARYFQAKDYKVQQTLRSLRQYWEWYRSTYRNYNYDDFEQFHKAQVFTYIGEDHMGRPVILNKASRVLVDKFDLDLYCVYYMYWLEIYISSKMRGYTDQILVIIDAQNISAANTNLRITQQNLGDSLKYGAQRQYKMLAVNVGTFGNMCWKFIRPLLPKATQAKIGLAGESPEDIQQTLGREMPNRQFHNIYSNDIC